MLAVWRARPRRLRRFPGVVANSSKWFAGFLFGAFLKDKRISLLDNRPLESLLGRRLDFSRIEKNIALGALDAVAMTCSGYTSGQSCSFFEAGENFEGWQRSQRIGIRRGSVTQDCLARLPFLFPAYKSTRVFGAADAPESPREPGDLGAIASSSWPRAPPHRGSDALAEIASTLPNRRP